MAWVWMKAVMSNASNRSPPMQTTTRKPFWLARAAALTLLVLAALLLTPTGARVAQAGEAVDALKDYDAEHQVVSDQVLDLLGLDVDHTIVLGARLPAVGSGRIRDALSPGALKETLLDILYQNAEELLMPLERDGLLTPIDPDGRMGSDSVNVPSAVALAVTLGDRDEAAAWHPLGLEWLGLDELTVVFALEAGNPWVDGLKNRGIDNGGISVALTGSFYVNRKRITCAVMVNKEIDFAGRMRETVQQAREKKLYEDTPETNTTTGSEGATHSSPSTYGPERRANPDAPALPPKSQPSSDDGIVAAGTQAETPESKVEGHADEDVTLTLALLSEKIEPRTIIDLLRAVGADCPLPDVLDNRLFVISSMMAVLELDLTKLRYPRELVHGVSILGTSELFGGRTSAQALLSVRRSASAVTSRSAKTRAAPTGPWMAYLGLRLEETSLADIAPNHEFPLLGSVSLPSVAFVYARGETSMRSTDLNPAEVAFFDDVKRPYGGALDTNYTLKLTSGINFMAPLPMAFLPQRIMNAIGIGMDAREKAGSSGAPSGTRSSASSTKAREPWVIVEGNPGIGLGLSPSLPRFSDMNMRITLPPISPERAPKVFVKGELYVELTGRPSLSLGGAITLDFDGDQVEFFLEGSMARDGAGFAVALTGGMAANEPWVAPFGIKWLTLNEVIAKISINTTGSLGIGFSADMVIGKQVVDTTVFVAINLASGVPTNFIFEGRTNKLSLADLAMLQQKMASVGGQAPLLPIAKLPNVELRDLYLRFAPKDDPDLGVEAGFGLAGSLWVEKGKSGSMDRVAEVDVLLSKDGIEMYGFVRGYELGPVRWDDAEIDLSLTLARQAFSIKGMAKVVGNKMRLAVNLTPRGMLEDFMAAHGGAIGAGVDAAKAAANAGINKVKGAAATLEGSKRRRSVRKPLRRR
jgi:hypothetical protein